MKTVAVMALQEGMQLAEDIKVGEKIAIKRGTKVDHLVKTKLEAFKLLTVQIMDAEDLAETFYEKIRVSEAFKAFQLNYNANLAAYKVAVDSFIYKKVPFRFVDLKAIADALCPDTISGKRASGTYVNCINANVKLVFDQAVREDIIATNPCTSATLPKMDTKEKKAKKDKNASTTFSWRGFFNWYYERENEENRMKARFNAKYHDETLDAVRHCMEEVFPGFTNLRIEDRPRTHFVLDKQGMPIDFSLLSDGEKSYITLVLDIARRLAERSEDPTAIFSCEHVILIDEVDLHLHPSWQLFVISNLRRMFPACQFFITSHSPLVLSSLEQQGLLVVLRNGRRFEVSDIPYGDNGDYILKRFFGLNEVRNPEVQREIDAVAAELGKRKPNLEAVEQALDKLSDEGVNFDEAVKMRLVLAQKKKEK